MSACIEAGCATTLRRCTSVSASRRLVAGHGLERREAGGDDGKEEEAEEEHRRTQKKTTLMTRNMTATVSMNLRK